MIKIPPEEFISRVANIMDLSTMVSLSSRSVVTKPVIGTFHTLYSWLKLLNNDNVLEKKINDITYQLSWDTCNEWNMIFARCYLYDYHYQPARAVLEATIGWVDDFSIIHKNNFSYTSEWIYSHIEGHPMENEVMMMLVMQSDDFIKIY